MAITIISSKLPNTTDDSSGSQVYSNFLTSERIAINSSNAVTHYQCLQDNGYPIRDEELNCYLEVKAQGFNSQCAIDCEDVYGAISEIDYQDLLTDLEQEFRSQSYQFSSDSVVYKGIASKPYYKKFDPSSLQVGDQISVHTFFSTTVSKDRALNYGKILLVISGLDKVMCIIPPVASIPNSGAQTDEQEVLINKDFTLAVDRIDNNEIYVSVVEA
ncbi:TPA: hypothetical protein NJZ52_004510 [Vibrio parahaemolyticus]|nr:hypothetical protein [Vibrio parahaemolyticus]